MKHIVVIHILVVISMVVSPIVFAQRIKVQNESPASSNKVDSSLPDPAVPEQNPPTQSVDPTQTDPAPTVPVTQTPLPTQLPPLIPTTTPPSEPTQTGYYPPLQPPNTTGSTVPPSTAGTTQASQSKTDPSSISTRYSTVPNVSSQSLQTTNPAGNEENITNNTTPTPTIQPPIAINANEPQNGQMLPQLDRIIRSTGYSIPLIGSYLREPAFAYYPNNQLGMQETATLLGISFISFFSGLSLVSSRFPRFVSSQLAYIKSFIV